jgi:cytochrome c biogenesis protein
VSAATRPAKPFVDELLDVLSNVLFPVVVFLVWAVMTAIGTIVDQGKEPQAYYDMYPPYVANMVLRLHLDTILHSIPYFSLIVLLLVSMSVCTFRRVIPKRFPKDRAVPIENFGLHGHIAANATRDDAAGNAQSYLRSRGFGTRTQEIDGTRWIFGDKHTWARYGVLVAHLGFAVIAFGVFLGWLAGFKGELQIFNGESAAVPERPGLSVHLDRFTAQFEPVDTPNGVFFQAAKFQSDVTVDESGALHQANIIVNHPYKTQTGVYFYQASYGFGGRFDLKRHGLPVRLAGTGRLMPQDQVFLPGTSREIEYMTLLGPSDPSQVPVGVPLPKTNEYALWLVHDNVPTTDKPLLVPVGKTIDVGDGYTLTALPPVPWTGLTYQLDPGEGWVGLGAAILVGGFVMALFFVPIKLYVRVRQGADASTIDVAATTTKGNAIYEAEFQNLLAGLGRAGAAHADLGKGEAEEAYA